MAQAVLCVRVNLRFCCVRLTHTGAGCQDEHEGADESQRARQARGAQAAGWRAGAVRPGAHGAGGADRRGATAVLASTMHSQTRPCLPHGALPTACALRCAAAAGAAVTRSADTTAYVRTAACRPQTMRGVATTSIMSWVGLHDKPRAGPLARMMQTDKQTNELSVLHTCGNSQHAAAAAHAWSEHACH